MINVKSLGGAAIVFGSVIVLHTNLFAQGAPVVHGEVMKVDLTSGQITIRHGPIKNLGMTNATETDDFKVADPIMLNALMSGERIKFTADRVNGQLTLATIQP